MIKENTKIIFKFEPIPFLNKILNQFNLTKQK